MSTTVNGLAPKQSYDELTETQKAVVDELVEDDSRTQEEIADAAGCTAATVSNVKQSYPHIIAQESVDRPDDSDSGGNAADLDAELGDDRPVQHFSERPVKNPSDGPIAAEDDGPDGEDALEDTDSGYPLTGDDRPDFAGGGSARIDDFLPERTCERLEAIAEDIMPVGIERRASVEEVITHLAETYTLASETADIRE